MGVYNRRVAPLGSNQTVESAQKESTDRIAAAAAAVDSSATARLRRQASGFLADAGDADGELIMKTVSKPLTATASDASSDEDEIAHRRHVWLTLTAFYEQIYLMAFPVLFCLFLVIFFWVYVRRRRLHLEQLLGTLRASNASAGCWCTDQDDWVGCMAPHQYREYE
ncbi:hypothetical protein FJT64_012880 [Amphibalanus amphitrite]|uniref:Uncharacterized protein n=2 Tax=Amphibalanus amphitrite TaxID=1232801 RepID=A0A6A4V4Q3_AMPAM|nr:hypothetical protein FJT64_012880 [Amphibalanus amphitrite]